MKKNIWGLLFVLALAACGGSETENTNNTNETNNTENNSSTNSNSANTNTQSASFCELLAGKCKREGQEAYSLKEVSYVDFVGEEYKPVAKKTDLLPIDEAWAREHLLHLEEFQPYYGEISQPDQTARLVYFHTYMKPNPNGGCRALISTSYYFDGGEDYLYLVEFDASGKAIHAIPVAYQFNGGGADDFYMMSKFEGSVKFVRTSVTVTPEEEDKIAEEVFEENAQGIFELKK